MELKRVIAKDNKAAMDQVVALYGPDALVVSGHRVRNQFELIVAVDIVPDLNPPGDDEDTWPLAAQAPNPVEAAITASLDQPPAFRKVLFEPEAGTKTPASEADERSGAERARDAFRAKEVVDLVRSEIQILRQEIQLQHQTTPWWARTQAKDALNPVAELLVQSPIPGRLKTLLMDTVVDEPSIEAAQISLQNILIEQLTVAEFDLEDYRGTHAFYGPSGVGKTTFVGKIALAAANQFGADDVVLISHVDHKLGAWNQTQMIAAEAGIRCYRATSNDMTRTLLRELSQYGCVLIDTAGVDWMATRDTLEALDGDLLHHLLVAAETSQTTLRKCQFGSRAWDSVNLTKIDESTAYWNIIDAIMGHRDIAICGCSSSPSIQQPVVGTSLRRLVESTLATLELEQLSPPSQTPKADSRQARAELSTIEFLTGLSATPADRVTDPRNSRH